MKSFMMSMVVQKYLRGTPDAFRAEFPFAVLVWEPSRWAPTGAGFKTTLVVDGPAPQPGLARGAESLVLALEPRKDGRELVLGRGQDCDLCLNDGTVSSRHMSFQYDGGWSVSDLSSRNGTSVDGQRVIPGLHSRLQQGTVITAGQVLLRFHTSAGFVERLSQDVNRARAPQQRSTS